jgi:hypothetical protein
MAQDVARFSQLREQIQLALFQGLDEPMGSQLKVNDGQEPLETVIHQMIRAKGCQTHLAEIGETVLRPALKAHGVKLNSVSEEQLTDALSVSIEQTLYRSIMQRVLEKMKRIVSIQVALPGNPAFDLPDLFGQTGHRWLLSPVDFDGSERGSRPFSTKPMAREFLEEIGNIIKLRKYYPALANGHLMFPERSADDPILPIIRDNGEQQVMMLINTGQPDALPHPSEEELVDYIVGQKAYPNLRAGAPMVADYKLDVSGLNLSPGTVYQVLDTSGNLIDRMVVSRSGELVQQNHPDQGLDIPILRVLVREDAPASA